MEKLPIRLAMRREGNWWVAYLANSDSMTGATELGRIKMTIVANNKAHKDAFQDLMAGIITDMIERIVGARPEMKTEDAPEHEKSGTA